MLPLVASRALLPVPNLLELTQPLGPKGRRDLSKISTHGNMAARRTFICFALSNGIPPQVVMKWTGHSDYKAMRPYIDIAEKTKSDAMKLIDNAWGM